MRLIEPRHTAADLDGLQFCKMDRYARHTRKLLSRAKLSFAVMEGLSLLYETLEGQRRKELTSGVAQGSILGQNIWNASYDNLLRLDMPEESDLVGYADDVAALVESLTCPLIVLNGRSILTRRKADLAY